MTDVRLRLGVQHGCSKTLFYPLAAHFGKWESAEGKKLIWGYWENLCTARSSNTNVTDKQWDEEQQYQERLKKAGLCDRIIPHLMNNGISPSPVCFEIGPPNLVTGDVYPGTHEHLEWFRSYYHFVRMHESLEEE